LHCIALHCIALHCIALHCIALHCIALHCIALHCIALSCNMLHWIASHCAPLHCIMLCPIALHRIVLHCIFCVGLHCIPSHCAPLQFIVLHHVVLCWSPLHCIVLSHAPVVSHCIVLHQDEFCCIVVAAWIACCWLIAVFWIFSNFCSSFANFLAGLPMTWLPSLPALLDHLPFKYPSPVLPFDCYFFALAVIHCIPVASCSTCG